MSAELVKLFNDLDFARLRVNRPAKFVFLCGGKISQAPARAESLRDYLCRIRKIETKLPASVVLAETAIQLYRDTSYTDLISFEEDIARLSSLVLVIAESAGSLAELGAFSTNETIRQSLRIILQTNYENTESFVRYGPIRRVEKRGNRGYLGVYPWQVNANQRPIVATVKPHYGAIKDFIQTHLSSAAVSSFYDGHTETGPFFVLYWIIYLALAIPVAELEALAVQLLPHINAAEVRNRLYCMQLAGWTDRIPYSNKDYLCVRHDADPFDYAFRAGVAERDSTRRKFIVTQSLRSHDLPKHVRLEALSRRRGGA